MEEVEEAETAAASLAPELATELPLGTPANFVLILLAASKLVACGVGLTAKLALLLLLLLFWSKSDADIKCPLA